MQTLLVILTISMGSLGADTESQSGLTPKEWQAGVKMLAEEKHLGAPDRETGRFPILIWRMSPDHNGCYDALSFSGENHANGKPKYYRDTVRFEPDHHHALVTPGDIVVLLRPTLDRTTKIVTGDLKTADIFKFAVKSKANEKLRQQNTEAINWLKDNSYNYSDSNWIVISVMNKYKWQNSYMAVGLNQIFDEENGEYTTKEKYFIVEPLLIPFQVGHAYLMPDTHLGNLTVHTISKESFRDIYQKNP
ncbi:hypothetical protein CL634_09100 [bacterium]|nr:hypothetical protein [bacterium]